MARVPYKQLERAESEARKQFPRATSVKALWTPAGHTEICVEVWRGNHAQVHPWEPKR